MKKFIKSGYLFLIFFVLFFSKDYLLSFFAPKDNISLDSYTQSLEEENQNINLIKNHNLLNSFSYARVFYSNPYKEGEIVVLINSDKIEINDLVINEKGLVGVISKVYKNYAFVRLLTSSDNLLQVKVGTCYGILKTGEKLIVDNINNYCEVAPDQKVYTSNLGGFNEEILIGTIYEEAPDKNEIAKTYYVKPEVDFNNLNYFIIISKEV